jgi:AAA domain/DnaB-like helicase N terminal domain
MNAYLAAHNTPAEQALLGLLLRAPQRADTCGVHPADLDPSHGHDLILSALLEVHDQHGTVEPLLLIDHLHKRDQLARIGTGQARGHGYLSELTTAAGTPGSLGHYTRLIREATTRRGLMEVSTRLAQTVTEQPDLDVMLDNAARLLVHMGMLVDAPTDDPHAPIPGASTMTDFINEPASVHSWVIPGVLERADRVMLVAGEGAGKSVLGRQICALLAAGRHPFAPRVRIRPRRTLLVDLENPPDLVRRHMRGLYARLDAENLDWHDRAWRWTRPAGIDLRNPRDRGELTRLVERARPDLVSIGPLYKAALPRPGDTYETAAADTAAAIDALRERYGCAFWIEHHAPKADPAGHRAGPVGSSYWMRWPEFGLLLRPAPDAEPTVFELGRFRGDRDERAWPERLVKGAGPWPWTADYEPETRALMMDGLNEDTTT